MSARTRGTTLFAILLLSAAPAAAQVVPAAATVYETANFRVEAADVGAAKLLAERAEECRKALAVAWLGKELPAWDKPCPVTVAGGFGPIGGRSGFTFGTGKAGKPAVTGITIEASGPLHVLANGVVPHEVMHCVVTTHFGRPVPRWADEGLAILAESDAVQADTLARFRDFHGRGRSMSVKTLFELADYPDDRFAVYLQGYSVARFLQSRTDAGRADLLRFLAAGMTDGWDPAAKAVYGFANVAALEVAWAESLDRP